MAGVRVYDKGDYLCQATTHPPKLIRTHLAVVEAFAEITVENLSENPSQKNIKADNQKEIFIKNGSELKLKCELKKTTEKPKFIFWYHNGTMINFSPHRGRLVRLSPDGSGALLRIPAVSSRDGGNYTCAPQHLVADSVLVTIMLGEGKFAAVQEDSSTVSPAKSVTTSHNTAVLVIATAGGLTGLARLG